MTQQYRRHRGPHASQGLTLVELMVTLAVMALLASVAVPSFSRMVAANRLSNQTNELIASMNLARMEAVRRTQSVAIRSAGGNTAFHAGWSVFVDPDSDGTVADATNDTIRETQALSGTTTITRVEQAGGVFSTSDDGDAGFLVFTSRGARATGGTTFFKVCDSGNPAIPGRIVRVLTTGTISVISTNESCS